MTQAIPTIGHYMSTSPHFIGRDQSIERASKMMHDFHIRHLPVLDGGTLVGMITERDVALVSAMKDVDPSLTSVEEAMSTTLYSVTPDAKLDEVASEMARKRYGSAIVMQNGKVVGVFTSVDLARALAELLLTRLKN